MTPRSDSEKAIETTILTWLNLQPGCFAFKVQTMGVYDQRKGLFRKAGKGVIRGTSDIIGLLHGQMLALEVKTPHTYKSFFSRPGELEARQKLFLDQVRSKGGIAEVVCSLTQVITLIESLLTSRLTVK